MKNIKVHFSSATNNWATPQIFFEKLNSEFNFTLDPCADEINKKCPKFFTKKENGLIQNWDNEIVFMNPPYGREIGKWIKKASEAKNSTVVCLLPSRTDTKYFHNFIYQQPKVEIRFIKGRLKFGENKNPAPFPSMVVIFRNNIK
jgi:site-specific DNA-methyltransferase (adenine-specific)